MNEKKDTEKTTLNQYGHTDVSSEKTPLNMPKYEFANKKTEKLVTALYMITDCMEVDDAIKNKLRFLAVELLSDMHKLPVFSPVEKHASLAVTLSRIDEITSLVEIAHMIGFVSEMNATILKKEFDLLVSELKSYQSEIKKASVPTDAGFGGALFENQKNSSFTLSEKMFEIETSIPSISETATSHQALTTIKDNTLAKRTPYMSFRNNDVSYPTAPVKRLLQEQQNEMSRTERTEKILRLIKDKKDLSGGAQAESGVSIKDISIGFAGCSEKTIQRELNSLISKGQIKKIGAKRWSRYMVA